MLDKQVLSKIMDIIPVLSNYLYWYRQRIHHTGSTINHYVGTRHIAAEPRSKKSGHTANLDWQTSSFKPDIFLLRLCKSVFVRIYVSMRDTYFLGLQE